jgi:hypothetical protein
MTRPQLVTHTNSNQVEEELGGLERGILVALQLNLKSMRQFTLVHLYDARYHQLYRGISPELVKIWHDPSSEILPKPIQVENWNFGLKINQGYAGPEWTLYDFQRTKFFQLPEDIAREANQLHREIAIKKYVDERQIS